MDTELKRHMVWVTPQQRRTLRRVVLNLNLLGLIAAALFAVALAALAAPVLFRLDPTRETACFNLSGLLLVLAVMFAALWRLYRSAFNRVAETLLATRVR